MDAIPKVIKTEILSYLELKDKIKMREVNQQWKRAADDEKLYNPKLFPLKKQHEILVKELFEKIAAQKGYCEKVQIKQAQKEINLLKHRIEECRKDYDELIIELNCRTKIMSIFGGESEYYKIPFLGLEERNFCSHRSSEHNSSPFMTFEKEKLLAPQNLKYSIMRGNIEELHFFKIRTKNKLNNTWAIITIFEQYRVGSKRVFGWRAHTNYGQASQCESLCWWISNPNENNWVVYSCFTQPFFEELRKTIQNGENSVEVIE